MDFLKFLVWLVVQIIFAVALFLAAMAVALDDIATALYGRINESGRE